MHTNKLVIGCDDAALPFKEKVKAHLAKNGYEVEDMGISSQDDTTLYPNVAAAVARNVQASKGQKRGILICGTGIGMAMTANKFKGIRAAQVHDAFSAERAALSNDANIITMGARIIAPEFGIMLIMQWLALEFKPGPSSCKVDAIGAIENETMK